MHRLAALVSLIAFGCVPLACSSDDETGLPDIPACEDYADALEQRNQTCCNGGGESRESYKRGCQMRHAVDGTTVDEAKRAECWALEQEAWASCTGLLLDSKADHVCNEWVVGLKQEGEACLQSFVDDCAPGLYCYADVCNSHERYCRKAPEVGDPCVECDWCGDGKFCNDGVCVAEGSVELGGNCSGYQEALAKLPCVDGAYCNLDTCVPLPLEGETCSVWCADGLSCVDATCVPGAGPECSQHSDCPSHFCRGGECMVGDVCSVGI